MLLTIKTWDNGQEIKISKTVDGSTDLHMLVEWLGGRAQGSGSFKVPLSAGKLGRWHLNKTKQCKGWDSFVDPDQEPVDL